MSQEALTIDSDSESVELPYEPPLDWAFFLRFLTARSTPGVEEVSEGQYSRTISLDERVGLLRVEHLAARSCLKVTAWGEASQEMAAIAARVERIFDLAADMSAVNRVLLADARLAPLVQAAPGIRLQGAWSAFEVLTRAIVGQQVSVRAASTIMGRIAERFGQPIRGDRSFGPRYLFPSARAVADGDFSNIGMPGKRAQAVRNVARVIADGLIPFPESGEQIVGVTRASIKAALLAQPGIGPWTVEYFALRGLGDTDAWPGADLVLRRELLLNVEGKLSPAEQTGLTNPWRPYRGYAALHFWNKAIEERLSRKKIGE